MSKQTLLKNLKNVYCRLQPSAHHGVGVFAVRRIPKGINPFELPIRTELVNLSEADLGGLPEGIKEMIRQYNVNQSGRYVVSTLGFNLLELEFFVNHSTAPNLLFDEERGCYRTARAVAPGEELTGDYNRYAPAMPAIRYRNKRPRIRNGGAKPNPSGP